MIYWQLFISFFKIGLFTFGGGYAMLPLLEKDLVVKRKWTTLDDLTDYFAIGQCTPGLIALNVSTFIGHKKKGIPGAIVATLGFITGPIAIILLILAIRFAANEGTAQRIARAFEKKG